MPSIPLTEPPVQLQENETQCWLLGINKMELMAWVKRHENLFDATLEMALRRLLNQLDDDTRPFEHLQYWAAFCAIGQP